MWGDSESASKIRWNLPSKFKNTQILKILGEWISACDHKHKFTKTSRLKFLFVTNIAWGPQAKVLLHREKRGESQALPGKTNKNKFTAPPVRRVLVVQVSGVWWIRAAANFCVLGPQKSPSDGSPQHTGPRVMARCTPRALQIYCWKFFRRESGELSRDGHRPSSPRGSAAVCRLDFESAHLQFNSLIFSCQIGYNFRQSNSIM